MGALIGIKAAGRLLELVEGSNVLAVDSELLFDAKSLARYMWVADNIEGFWLSQLSRMSRSWVEHKDINMVMSAASLTPDEFLRAY